MTRYKVPSHVLDILKQEHAEKLLTMADMAEDEKLEKVMLTDVKLKNNNKGKSRQVEKRVRSPSLEEPQKRLKVEAETGK